MLKKSWAPCLALLMTQGAVGQTMPSAGAQMQQLPLVPLVPGVEPRVDVEPPTTKPPQSAQLSVFVAQRLNVTGAYEYNSAELLKVAEFEPGREVTLQVLYAMADKITQHYRRHGFLVARAYLPAQEVKDGVITMVVQEGHYGQIALNNISILDSQVPAQILSGLTPGDVIAAPRIAPGRFRAGQSHSN